ncbi:MAG: hypothetical protein ACRD1L_11380 [Terriglobales bacterium]
MGVLAHQCDGETLRPGSWQPRRRRGGRLLSAGQWQAAQRQIAEDRARWNLYVVGSDVLERAEAVAVQLAIRSLDSIHLATAQILRLRLPHPLPFITADRPQAAAAAVLGLEVQLVPTG